ncbi:MAG: hypothetical protein M3P20_04530, partial [Thermoproteota archaeon]|nr:hypothetical protein [Thermoproteota archaeon]
MSDLDHFYFEIFAVILSTIVAFYCITRAYTLNERSSLYVGIGFSTIAVIDLLHALFSYLAVGNNQFLSYFIPQTWFAGRTFLGAMLVIAVAKYAPKVEMRDKRQIKQAERIPESKGILNEKSNSRKYDSSYGVHNNSSTNDDGKNNFDSTNNQHIEQEEGKLHRSLLLSLFVLSFLAVSVVVISFFT